jgi:hypothetical protein
MRAIKRALDPTGIMNPATIFPDDVPPTPALDASLVPGAGGGQRRP